MTDITFMYLYDGQIQAGRWNGDPAVALESAIRCLAAVYEDGKFFFEDPQTGRVYTVQEDRLLRAGAAILAGIPFWGWYTPWIKAFGEPVRG